MSNLDVGLLILAGTLVLVGMIKGLVRILVGIAALVAAFALAARYHQPLADRLAALDFPTAPLRLVSYVAIFLCVMLLGGLAALLARKVIKAAMLSWADRLGGAALGLVAATLLAALLILPVVAYFPGSRPALEHSVLAPYVMVLADLANILSPEELADRYREGIEDLRRRWRGQGEASTPSVQRLGTSRRRPA